MAGKRLLVTGASGFLGWNVCRVAARTWEVTGVYNSRPLHIPSVNMVQYDLTDPEAVWKIFSEHEPDAFIHTAAAADPNFCQNNPNLSTRININAPAFIAELCARFAIPCVFTSSDLVFDGTSPPYREEDTVNPLNLYGEQKVAAEQKMLAVNPATIICRMPLMYGDAPQGAKSFIQPMIETLRSGRIMKLFTDEYRTPLSAIDAAKGLLLALEHPDVDILHFGGPQKLSRYEMGMRLSEALHIKGNIIPVLQKDVAMAAPRAADVSYDITRARTLGFSPKTFEESLSVLSCITGLTGK